MISISPTFYGYIESPFDSMLLIEAIKLDILVAIPRRLNQAERGILKSGDVYVHKVSEGIKRWTDGKSWSPSRVLGHFLTYREVQEKRYDNAKPKFNIKPEGLIKKTISIQADDEIYHVISYYTELDLEFNRLIRLTRLETPSAIAELKLLTPRPMRVFPLGHKRKNSVGEIMNSSGSSSKSYADQIWNSSSQFSESPFSNDLNYFLDYCLSVNPDDFETLAPHN